MMDQHVSFAFFVLLPKGLIVQCYCFKPVYGTNAEDLIAH